jgi:hypothetical protein
MKRTLIPIVLTAVIFLTCGIDEYYYLPQVEVSNINARFYTEADIKIPPISLALYYYATGYTIFYRIYISESENVPNDIRDINPTLASDLNAFLYVTDPTNAFRNRKYYVLSFAEKNNSDMLPLTGGTLHINFSTSPGNPPYASLDNNTNISLHRDRAINVESPNLFFMNSLELRTSSGNVDVETHTGEYAYVSMYIVAVGQNPENFSQIYSKPTHISIFKLPNY